MYFEYFEYFVFVYINSIQKFEFKTFHLLLLAHVYIAPLLYVLDYSSSRNIHVYVWEYCISMDDVAISDSVNLYYTENEL